MTAVHGGKWGCWSLSDCHTFNKEGPVCEGKDVVGFYAAVWHGQIYVENRRLGGQQEKTRTH
jgi:hypothetical protein